MKFINLQNKFISKNLFSNYSTKIILLIFFTFSAILYAIFGWNITSKLTNNTPLSQADRYIEKQMKNNPILADDIKRLKTKYGNAAVASKLKLDAEAIQQNLPVITLKEQIDTNQAFQELKLVKLSIDTDIKSNPNDLNNFITTYYQTLNYIPDNDIRNNLLQNLVQASHKKETWSIVSEGIGALIAWEATKDNPSLWRFYKENRSWLAEPLSQRIFNENLIFEQSLSEYKNVDPVVRMLQLIYTCEKYQNLFRKLSKNISDKDKHISFMSMAMHIFESSGKTVQLAINRYGMPIVEVLEVLYANPNTLENHIQNTFNQKSQAEAEAALLSQIYNKEPDIWQYSRTTGLALQFYLDVPSNANKVLAKYGSHPGFLVQLYENYYENQQSESNPLLVNAADAIATYEDLAVRTLFDYRDNYSFKTALKSPEIGKRIVPFAVRYPDRLQDVLKDPGWIDKNFDKSGRFKDDDRWWEALPGGAIAKVATNWANGYPCDWSELGWAAFDTVDVGLMVFTAGTSKAVTGTIKGTVKGTGRTAASVIHGTSLGGQKIKKLSQIFKRGSKNADEVLSVSSRSSKKSPLLQRIAIKIKNNADNFAKKIDKVSPSKHLTNTQYTKLIKRWRNIGIALALTKAYTKRETLKKAPEQIGETIGNVAHGAVLSAGTILASSAKSFLIPEVSGLGATIFIHVSVVILLLSIAAYISLKFKHKHVNKI